MPETAYIALGSNLGDRREYLDRALAALQEMPGIEVTLISSYYETTPVGGPSGQGDYLNAVAELRTELEPRELLDALLEVERRLGRVRSVRDAPRTIDLDVLFFGDRVIAEADLQIPHPRLQQRRFVLTPLVEIAADFVHPVLKRTVQQLLDELPESSEVVRPFASVANSVDPGQSLKVREAIGEQPTPVTAARELSGLRAVVTGSTSGIGRAIALELATAGAHVVIHGRREEKAVSVVSDIVESGGQASYLCTDLRLSANCSPFVADLWRDGPADIWINNAGADTLTGEAAKWSYEEKLDALLHIDVIATMLLCRDVGKLMQARGSGVIINIGWDQAETGMEGDSPQLFAAAKGAVMAFTRSLAVSLAPQVRVNCIAPGWIRTAWGETASQIWQDRVMRETPLARWGTPEDVAHTARWLVSPAAAFIMGQIIRVNGGAVR